MMLLKAALESCETLDVYPELPVLPEVSWLGHILQAIEEVRDELYSSIFHLGVEAVCEQYLANKGIGHQGIPTYLTNCVVTVLECENVEAFLGVMGTLGGLGLWVRSSYEPIFFIGTLAALITCYFFHLVLEPYFEGRKYGLNKMSKYEETLKAIKEQVDTLETSEKEIQKQLLDPKTSSKDSYKALNSLIDKIDEELKKIKRVTDKSMVENRVAHPLLVHIETKTKERFEELAEKLCDLKANCFKNTGSIDNKRHNKIQVVCSFSSKIKDFSEKLKGVQTEEERINVIKELEDLDQGTEAANKALETLQEEWRGVDNKTMGEELNFDEKFGRLATIIEGIIRRKVEVKSVGGDLSQDFNDLEKQRKEMLERIEQCLENVLDHNKDPLDKDMENSVGKATQLFISNVENRYYHEYEKGIVNIETRAEEGVQLAELDEWGCKYLEFEGGYRREVPDIDQTELNISESTEKFDKCVADWERQITCLEGFRGKHQGLARKGANAEEQAAQMILKIGQYKSKKEDCEKLFAAKIKEVKGQITSARKYDIKQEEVRATKREEAKARKKFVKICQEIEDLRQEAASWQPPSSFNIVGSSLSDMQKEWSNKGKEIDRNWNMLNKNHPQYKEWAETMKKQDLKGLLEDIANKHLGFKRAHRAGGEGASKANDSVKKLIKRAKRTRDQLKREMVDIKSVRIIATTSFYKTEIADYENKLTSLLKEKKEIPTKQIDENLKREVIGVINEVGADLRALRTQVEHNRSLSIGAVWGNLKGMFV